MPSRPFVALLLLAAACTAAPAVPAVPAANAAPQSLQNLPDARAPQEEQKAGALLMSWFRSLGDGPAMAGGAHLRVAPAQALGVEAGPVRAEVAAALRGRRVAAHAVRHGVAGDAALEALPRRLPMAGGEEPLRVMVTGIERHVHGGEPRAYVAAGAELLGIVAVAAGGGALIGLRRVAREEAHAVVPGRPVRRVGHVAVEALRPRMTGGALACTLTDLPFGCAESSRCVYGCCG